MPHQLDIDLYQTAGIGVLALLLGFLFTRALPVLKRYCIPAPVSGGLAVSMLLLLTHSIWGVGFNFDGTIKDVCMMLFFTSVGYQSNLLSLKRGGRPLVVMLALVTVLIAVQNLLSTGIARGMGLDPLVGMAAGSIPMCGGHGTSGGFSPVLESMGLQSAASITMACATFGLVAGSLIGGPLAENLIRKRHLAEESGSTDIVSGMESSTADPAYKEMRPESEEKSFRGYAKAVFILVLTMALGSCLSHLLAGTGVTFPTYFGSLIMACLIRNVCEMSSKGRDVLGMDRIISFGNICLSLFLGLAMINLKLWQQVALALPMIVILLIQTVIMFFYARFIVFNMMGRDYDAAVLASGFCGFGMGATPNAMANMQAITNNYGPAPVAFMIVPLVGSLFIDFFNAAIITAFANFL